MDFNWHFYRWIPHPPNATGIHNAYVWISQYSRLQWAGVLPALCRSSLITRTFHPSVCHLQFVTPWYTATNTRVKTLCMRLVQMGVGTLYRDCTEAEKPYKAQKYSDIVAGHQQELCTACCMLSAFMHAHQNTGLLFWSLPWLQPHAMQKIY